MAPTLHRIDYGRRATADVWATRPDPLPPNPRPIVADDCLHRTDSVLLDCDLHSFGTRPQSTSVAWQSSGNRALASAYELAANDWMDRNFNPVTTSVLHAVKVSDLENEKTKLTLTSLRGVAIYATSFPVG